MGLVLYNTLTRKKAAFEPLDAGNVRMYVCGPTVYDHAHIGNARPVIVFDVLYRLLRHLYGADHVTYARNITDVDDKINARAAEEKISIGELTGRTTQQFHQDIAALGCLPPTVEPRATEHIEQMKALIGCLVDKGHAYVAEDHVLFDVPSMPSYGRLSGRSTDDMIAGARVEVAPYKKDPMDFVLWKPSKKGEPSWPSPCGIETPGRPGWHIECSAMAEAHLGETFDIHGGGIDLVFPHHENEIAQSVCGHGTDVMARVWMHNGFLQVEGEKMSKSLGNFITINDLLRTDKFGGTAWSGQAIRLAMLMTQYRQPIDWTLDRLVEARTKLLRWLGPVTSRGLPEKGEVSKKVIDALLDDLNTSNAFTILDSMASESRGNDASKAIEIRHSIAATLDWLGLTAETDFAEARVDSQDRKDSIKAALGGVKKDAVLNLISARIAARKAKDFAEADRIRDELTSMGVQLMDAKDPATGEIKTTWEIAR